MVKSYTHVLDIIIINMELIQVIFNPSWRFFMQIALDSPHRFI